MEPQQAFVFVVGFAAFCYCAGAAIDYLRSKWQQYRRIVNNSGEQA